MGGLLESKRLKYIGSGCCGLVVLVLLIICIVFVGEWDSGS